MAKSFTLLRAKMSPESRIRAEAKTAAIMQLLPLQELRAAHKLTPEELAARLRQGRGEAVRRHRRVTHMTFRNFSLVERPGAQIIEIDYLGNILDLHNAAEFVGVEYLITTAELILSWNYYLNDGVVVVPFQIRFDGVSFFEISPRHIEMPRDEDDCLEQIIYREKIEFRFMGGMRIIVEAGEAGITSSGLIPETN